MNFRFSIGKHSLRLHLALKNFEKKKKKKKKRKSKMKQNKKINLKSINYFYLLFQSYFIYLIYYTKIKQFKNI